MLQLLDQKFIGSKVHFKTRRREEASEIGEATQRQGKREKHTTSKESSALFVQLRAGMALVKRAFGMPATLRHDAAHQERKKIDESENGDPWAKAV